MKGGVVMAVTLSTGVTAPAVSGVVTSQTVEAGAGRLRGLPAVFERHRLVARASV